MWKKVLAAVVMLILLAVPLVARRSYYYEGTYAQREIPRPDLAAVEAPTPEMASFQDRYVAPTPGTILVDRAHRNRFAMSELNVLQARLAARGQRFELAQTTRDLAERLRYARALVIIAPGEELTTDEIQLIRSFVDKGGRLLLVTDPTRFDVRFDDYGYVLGLDSDVDYINDLAARFGLVFQADYLYNTTENEGNFRNIKLTELAANRLTAGLEQVVFYATHSILSDELTLIAASGETRSSSSERVEKLAVAVLAADGAVLALGDLTFMTEPHNAVYDNDRLIANVAGFLGGAQRRYELADFPFFFGDAVDLVYADDPLLDSDLVMGGGGLQTYLAELGKELTIRETEDETQDTLFLGLYAHSEDVEPYLSAAGVTFVITPGGALETGVLTATTATPTATGVLTTSTLAVTSTAEITITAELSPVARSRVEITALGRMVVTGTAVLILHTDGDRHVLLVLANTETGLENSIERLTESNLAGCLLREAAGSAPTTLALCSSGEVEAGEGVGGWGEPGSRPTPAATPAATTTPAATDSAAETELEGRIIVVSLDEGEGRYDSMTSAEDYVRILGERYDVTMWSKAQDGSPGTEELLDYDLIIWTTGDFEEAIGDEESDMLLTIMLAEKPLIISGAYLDDTAPTAVQRDIQVADADHPVAQGFEPQEVISFLPPPAGGEYETSVLEADLTTGGVVVFVRGPDSEEAGTESVLIVEDESLGMRITLVGFPVYLLPQEAKSRLVLNLVEWTLASND